ncbi:DNA-directed RNA polymerase sigma-70 factor [Edaphobacter acidisoli]|uniref:DNA-directed RNA polymerase sigma-70 factor n=1 Tax=Edaphobacter acidisoli TaxID=2040573 RepID=A0A916RX84_9BACT|nr:sigma-70 family RNA polymerase sigma factor [Edaphobacter acidisoli]GGA71867.1 DNA-directed RNA polymerase sigma-70 factor [Edaphobacter acidisoli]
MRVDDQGFRGLVEEHQSMVFSIALRMLGDQGAAEEVAQDVFVELHDKLERLESSEHVRFWLRCVASHRATDYLRRRRARPESFAEEWTEQHENAVTIRMAASDAVETRLERMLLSLPEAMRTAVVLRYQEEMTPAEIADVLAQPVATVKSNLQRGLEMLRRKAEVVLKEFARER